MEPMPENIPPSSNPEGAENEKVFQISKRKVLYVELDEEISSLLERIQRFPYKEMYLVVPERAVLLQSVVNLQILKKKSQALGKTLSLITTDSVGAQLAYQADISVFDQYPSPKGTKSTSAKQESAEDLPLEPLKASRNDVEDDRPARLTEKKVSIFDVVKEVKGKRGFALTRLKDAWKSRQEKKKFKAPLSFGREGPSKKALGTLVGSSLAILLVISYIALPGATVTVTPQANVLEQSLNITLANVNVYGTEPTLGEAHVLVTYPLSVTVQKTVNYASTGQVFSGTNAGGTVTLINERTTPWALVAFTRLQTEEGLIFRTQEAISVPAATPAGYGSVEVPVLADEKDVYGRVIGESGNIGPSAFVLPGLREESQKILYGRSSTPMTGGTTVVTLQITQEDLDASAELLRTQLEAVAEDSLEKEIESRNATNGTSLMLLSDYGAITLGDPVLSIPTQLVGAFQDSFEVSGTLSVSGYAFDRSAFMALMNAELEARKSPDKALLKIDEDSLTLELFEINKTSGLLKFTATIKGIEAYDFNPETENGATLIKKIKEHIAGKPVKEAEDYVQNLSEINKVTISTWPIWAPTIPTVLENIEVEIDDAWQSSLDSTE